MEQERWAERGEGAREGGRGGGRKIDLAVMAKKEDCARGAAACLGLFPTPRALVYSACV